MDKWENTEEYKSTLEYKKLMLSNAFNNFVDEVIKALKEIMRMKP